jgi:hypothetical protein
MQGVLATPHVTIRWLQCDCAGGRGQRSFYFLDSDTWNYDPPHIDTVTIVSG